MLWKDLEQDVGTVLQPAEPTFFSWKQWQKEEGNSCFSPLPRKSLLKQAFVVPGKLGGEVREVLDHATSVHYVANEGYYGDDSLFSFCNEVMLGFAAIRAGVWMRILISW